MLCESCGSKKGSINVLNDDGESLELCENCYHFSSHDYELIAEN